MTEKKKSFFTRTHIEKPTRTITDIGKLNFSNERLIRNAKTLERRTQEFLEKSKEVHGDRYDYSKVQYVNSSTKVIIVCPKHGEFLTKPSVHILGFNCPNCRGYSQEETIKKFIEVHGDKYDYSKVEYVNGSTKVIIVCPKHGEFLQRPLNHIHYGNGCPKCGREQSRISNNLSQEKVIRQFREVHGDKYDYSKVVYVKSHEKVIIVCPKHGEFCQKPHAHKRGGGCKKCADDELRKTT